jgi:hypothetical protein
MKTKISRIDKYKALYQILNQYSEAFEGEALASVQSLSTLNGRLSALASNLTRPVGLVYQNRKNSRDHFNDSLKRTVRLAMAVARKTGNEALRDAAANYRNELPRSSDYRRYEMAQHLSELLTPHSVLVGALSNQPDFLQQLSTTVQEFSQTLTGTGLSLNERKSGKSEMNALLAECNRLLAQELDGLVEIRRESHPELYNLYTTLRRRRKPRSRTGEKPGFSDISGTVTDAVSGQPVAGAQITLLQQASVTDTDADGFFALEELHEGNYTVGCFAPGYQVPANTTVQLGSDDSVEINFALQPVEPILN